MTVIIRVKREKLCLVIFFVISVLWVLYGLVGLQRNEVTVPGCDRCRMVDSKSLKAVATVSGVDDTAVAFDDVSLYVNQLVMVEDGVLMFSIDQYVLKGLTELSSIRKSSDNIFFVEGSCAGSSTVRRNRTGGWMLHAVDACGVESAARANPGRPVYLLHSCPLEEDFALRVPEHARALLDLPNVHVVALDPEELSSAWPHPLPLTTSVLGLLALWRFGGTCLGLDSLVLRPLRPLGSDYCGYHDNSQLLSEAVLDCSPFGLGHALLARSLASLAETQWPSDTLMTSSVDQLCSLPPETPEDCGQWTAYDSSVLFTLDWADVALLLNDRFNSEFVMRVQTRVFVLSFFSRLFVHPAAKHGPTLAFRTLAGEYCPDVFRLNNKFFYPDEIFNY